MKKRERNTLLMALTAKPYKLTYQIPKNRQAESQRDNVGVYDDDP